MQPKKQLKVQYIGIFEERDSFYWPKNSGMGRPPPPLFGHCPKENVFFPLRPSLTYSLQSVERTLVCREGRVGGPLGKPGSGIFWCFSFEWDCNYMMIFLKVSLEMMMMKMQGMRLQGGDNHVESLKASLFNWSEAGKLMAESRFWGIHGKYKGRVRRAQFTNG